MRTGQLLKRNLSYYWRTNLAVVAGVAIAVAVLAGALLVGDSVRASLRDLFIGRLGNTDRAIAATGFFREELAADIRKHHSFASAGFAATCPLIALEGTITHEASGRLASPVRVYGVDERFWEFHGRVSQTLSNREILAGAPVARELGGQIGDSLVLRVQKPSAIPVESLHSKKEDLGRTLRLTMKAALAADQLGEFSLQPQQGTARSVFVPLTLLQTALEQEGKANLILIHEASKGENQAEKTRVLERILKETASLADYGIKLRALSAQQLLLVESDGGLVPDAVAETVDRAAQAAALSSVRPYLSYLVNSIRRDDGRAIPYSIVTGVDGKTLENLQHAGAQPSGCDPSLTAGKGSLPATAHLPPLILNDWAAKDLGATLGERLTLEYYVWHDEGKLVTRTGEFRVECIIPMTGLAADRDLVPEYPGITEAESFGDWDPPFPIDLKRIRPQDEDYWKKFRTTPKAFIPLEVGQELWQSRFGKLTSLRIQPGPEQTLPAAYTAFDKSLRNTLDPVRDGFSILPVRVQGIEASRGATDFGEYFLYFSFFLVVSALLLTALFFRLGVEQRLREIGVLQAVGFSASRVRNLFLMEGLLLSVIGSVSGLAGAIAYGWLMMTGLSTWWVDAVGTTMLKLHVAPLSLFLGALGGVLAAVICIVWTLARLRKSSARSLLMGNLGDTETRRRGDAETRQAGDTETTSPRPRVPVSPRLGIAVSITVLALAVLVAASLQLIGQTAGFFGGGLLLLVAFLSYQSAWLREQRGSSIQGSGWWSVSRLGFRNTTYRPGRSVLCIALIASAAFIIVSVDAFRRRDGGTALDRKSGTGGYPLLAESLVPLVHDPNASEGRSELNLTTEDSATPLSTVEFTRFRVRPGDDASCLNLYQPRNPRIVAATDEFIRSNRFTFASSLAGNDEEEANPWLLLNHEFPDGAIPVIADANSLTYVLHLKLGEDFVLTRSNGPVRLRVVGALSDSIFQSEFLMAENNFLRLFPEQEGYRFFLIDTTSPDQSSEIAATLEDRLSDFGFDVASTGARLASFHRVENTYLSTFQMLGGLGLLLGTMGLAAVLLRNVLERRRELALLRAVGYNSSHFTLMVVAENAWLLVSGLITGTVCALLAIAPVFFERGGEPPNISLGFLLLAVLISGFIASLVATWAALRSPLLPALRAE